MTHVRRTTCIFCNGPLMPILGHPHWQACALSCVGSAKMEPLLPPNLAVVQRPVLMDRGLWGGLSRPSM